MAGIFISHTSADKTFADRLALDLINRGFPVRFEERWGGLDGPPSNEAPGSVDEQTHLLVLLSQNSRGSAEVGEALDGALMKEFEVGRKFVVVAVISECEVPPTLADYVAADFSKSYLKGLEKLSEALRKKRAHEIPCPLGRQIIPFVFSQDIYLQTDPLMERLKAAGLLGPEWRSPGEDQLVVAPDETYVALKDRLIERIENVYTDPFFSTELVQSLNGHYRRVLELEEMLMRGLRMLIAELPRAGTADLGEACYWFAKRVRGEMLYYLWFCQNPARPDTIVINPDCEHSLMGDGSRVAQFFGVKHVDLYDIGPREAYKGMLHVGSKGSITVWMDSDSALAKDLRATWEHPELIENRASAELSKYIIPQMLYRHLAHSGEPLIWNFADYAIGLR